MNLIKDLVANEAVTVNTWFKIARARKIYILISLTTVQPYRNSQPFNRANLSESNRIKNLNGKNFDEIGIIRIVDRCSINYSQVFKIWPVETFVYAQCRSVQCERKAIVTLKCWLKLDKFESQHPIPFDLWLNFCENNGRKFRCPIMCAE